MRGNPFALSDGFARHFCYTTVDDEESSVLSKDDPTSRFYIVTLVTHDQSFSIAELAKRLDRELDSVGIANLYFHAGPIIHAHDQFMFMNWDLRRKIFYRMLAFANHVPFQYACLVVDKKFADDTETIISSLERQLAELVDGHRLDFTGFETVKVYYDCGLSLSKSEEKFFGGVRAFKHNVLRVIRRKAIV